MNNIEVAIIGGYEDPGRTTGFLAKLTQRGHRINNMRDLQALYEADTSDALIRALANMPLHGTVKRFTPITIAIVGASRRFLAQARTNQVGFNYVSASLQYSDYSGNAQFVVPYALRKYDADNAYEISMKWRESAVATYLRQCSDSMATYKSLAIEADNDTAGYVAPQGLRNILIMQGNHQAWDHFIRSRSCNRNTVETQYVTMLIWEQLLLTKNGQEFFGNAGPDCMYGACREGKMCCGTSMRNYTTIAKEQGITVPRAIISDKWPLLNTEAQK